MKNLLEFLLNHLVSYPDEVSVVEEKDEYGTVVYRIKVHPDDMGKVIGRRGKVIKSIRKISQIFLVKEGSRAQIVLED